MVIENKRGVLYLVATPIGNLEDITYRAVRILSEADLICAEDTRTSGKLLSHYDIHTPLTSYHEHNKISKLPYLLQRLKEGQVLAVITDAGTPGISDPGEELVKACRDEGIDVFAIPGAVAAVTALTSSGISSRRFAFEAFLPKKKKIRKRILDELAKETRTIVIYEAPHHLKDTLYELAEALGEERRIVLCRELTKRYEQKQDFSLKDAYLYFNENEPRGEYVVVIEGKTYNDVENENLDKWASISIEEHYRQYINEGMERKEAMKRVADERGIPKREVYAAVAK